MIIAFVFLQKNSTLTAGLVCHLPPQSPVKFHLKIKWAINGIFLLGIHFTSWPPNAYGKGGGWWWWVQTQCPPRQLSPWQVETQVDPAGLRPSRNGSNPPPALLSVSFFFFFLKGPYWQCLSLAPGFLQHYCSRGQFERQPSGVSTDSLPVQRQWGKMLRKRPRLRITPWVNVCSGIITWAVFSSCLLWTQCWDGLRPRI